ncbi:MAG: tRNA preQ1(34) S-adenosylmethionine ribosyltransferase-isomerase QueA [Nitrosomonadaceae bacterium]|nr:tRNA preQ1(34) S-adenosylmethionine ribosyltransferase-isomerase QueA [Nitrosomonadaceae bacterium]|tara:strand:- start:556 stop:1590 length:1035 start_codon:yes stop_codon:yes gene_type:complete
MKTQDFNFSLPSELIAQFPVSKRSSSRMLYLDGKKGTLQDTMFTDLPDYMQPGDVMVLNDTRVIKARLFGTKESGGKLEVMVERILDEHCVLAMIRASHAPKIGSIFNISGVVPVTVLGREHNFYRLYFDHKDTVIELLDRYGNLPLPPYIPREITQEDEVRYQTVYAKEKGAVAAPTAGLHFDEAMILKLRKMRIIIAYVTLHVGSGTFQPVQVENINDHKMHKEVYHVPEETIEAIHLAKSLGGRVLAVGTTSLRALEAAAKTGNGKLIPGHGNTDIFITPGYRLNIVDRLLTNFHSPCSTLMMLVSAFGGSENICQAYQHAIDKGYRFLSYGDAMLIERKV